MSDTALTPTQPVNQMLGFRFVSLDELKPEQIQVLKATVAKGTTDTELVYFMNVALAQDLDPFRKEVWCIKRAKKQKFGDRWDYKRLADGSIDYTDADLVIMTGRDGFLKMAKRDPTFDFIQSAEVRQGDHFVFDPVTGHVEHRFGASRGQILGAYAVITRKDGVKIGKYLTFSEYYDDRSDVWKDNPTAMMVKSVEAVLCKQFANVTGITAEETLHREGNVIDNSPSAQAQAFTLKDDLVRQIDACTTKAEFDALRDKIALAVGKLFGKEKDEVYAAAKAKKAELEALTPTSEPTVQDGEIVEPTITLNWNGHGEKPITKMEGAVAGDIQPGEVIKGPSPNDPMPEEKFVEWLEVLRAQETEAGIEETLADALRRPMSLQQQETLTQAADKAKAALEAAARKTAKKTK